MANNPSFSLYVNDLEGGTRHMSDEEFGCYIRLLLAQFNRGGTLPTDEKFLSRFCTSFDSSWNIVKEKFKYVGEGKIQNQRLKKEMAKRSKFIDKQEDNGRKGGRPPTKKKKNASKQQNPNKTQSETQTEPVEEPKVIPLTNPHETQTQTQKKPLGYGYGKGKGNGKGNTGEGVEGDDEIPRVVMPFNGEFSGMWKEWKRYKLEQHEFAYKSEGSEQAALHELVTYANGDEETAIKIIKKSMAKGWKGLFQLKNSDNGTTKSNTSLRDSVQAEFNKRFGSGQ